MDTLFSLPEEILESILSIVNSKDILRLSQCSKLSHKMTSNSRLLSNILLSRYNLKRIPINVQDFLYLIYTKCEIKSFSIPVIPQHTLYCLLKHNLSIIYTKLGEEDFLKLCSRLPDTQRVFLTHMASMKGCPGICRNPLYIKSSKRWAFYQVRSHNVAERIIKTYCSDDSFISDIRKLASECSQREVYEIIKRCLKIGKNEHLKEILQLEQAVVTKELVYKSGKSLCSFLLLKEKCNERWSIRFLITKAVKYENSDLVIHLLRMDRDYTKWAIEDAILRDWPELIGILEKNGIEIPLIAQYILTDQQHSRRYFSSL